MLALLPNLMTFARIALIPVIVGLLYIPAPWASWAAFGLYLLAAVTDWLDGYLARRLDATSPLGRFLDPIADKLLVTALVVVVIANGTVGPISALPALVILCREILVSGLREYLAEQGVGMPVSKLAKWKTASQMVALALLILGSAAPWGYSTLMPGLVLLWIAGVLTAVTGWDYLKTGLHHMRGSAANNERR